MAPKYGWQGQIGWAEEVTWGTFVAPTKFAEFISESLRLEIDRLYSPGIRNTRSRLKPNTLAGRRAVSGEVEFDFWVKDLGLWIKHALGSVASAQQGMTTAYVHTFTPADAVPTGLSVEVGRSVQAHRYLGCRVTTLTFEALLNQYVKMRAGVRAKDETLNASPTAATYTAANELLKFTQGIFKIDAVQTDVHECRVTIDNMLREDDYRLGNDLIQSLDPKGRSVTGTFRLPYDAVAQYNKFRDFVTAALNLKFTGSLIEAGHNFELELDLPVVYYDGSTPPISGAENEMELDIPFKAYKDTSPELTIRLKNNQTTV